MAHAREQEAHHEGREAAGRLARASALLDDARRDLRRAQRHGEAANRRAGEAGAAAAAALADVAGAAKRAPQPPARLAMPVTRAGGGGLGGLFDGVLGIVNPTLAIGTVRVPGGVTVDLSTRALDIADGGLAGQLGAAAERARRARATAWPLLPPHWTPPAYLPAEAAKQAGANMKNTNTMIEREIDTERTVTRATKILRRGSTALTAVNAALQARDNAQKGMPPLENAVRSAASTYVGGELAVAAGTVCAPLGIGALACGAAGGYAGAKLGDAVAGVGYKLVDEAAQVNIKPLVGAAGTAAAAVGDAVHAGLGTIGIHP
jgi:hypothetical protein